MLENDNIKELTPIQMELIEANEGIIFATSDLNNQPRSIIVIPSRVEKDRMIIANVQMNKSIDNIKNNEKCFINAYIKEHELQIKIVGIAKVYEDGDLFNEIKSYEEANNLPDYLKVHSIIVVDYQDVFVCQE